MAVGGAGVLVVGGSACVSPPDAFQLLHLVLNDAFDAVGGIGSGAPSPLPFNSESYLRDPYRPMQSVSGLLAQRGASDHVISLFPVCQHPCGLFPSPRVRVFAHVCSFWNFITSAMPCPSDVKLP